MFALERCGNFALLLRSVTREIRFGSILLYLRACVVATQRFLLILHDLKEIQLVGSIDLLILSPHAPGRRINFGAWGMCSLMLLSD